MKFAYQLSLVTFVGFLCLTCCIEAQDDALPSALVDLGTAEDELVDVALEHEEVADKCASIKQKIDQATSSGTPVDQKLQKRFDDCQTYLKDLEEDIEEQVQQILGQK